MKLSIPKVKKPEVKLSKPDFSKLKNLHPRNFNTNTFLALLSYLYIFAFIPLIFSKRSTFVKFHARQGLILLIVWTIGLFSFYLPALPYLFALFILIEMIYGIVNVVLNRERQLFWIGRAAARI